MSRSKRGLAVKFGQARTSPGGTKQLNIGLVENEDADVQARLAEWKNQLREEDSEEDSMDGDPHGRRQARDGGGGVPGVPDWEMPAGGRGGERRQVNERRQGNERRRSPKKGGGGGGGAPTFGDNSPRFTGKKEEKFSGDFDWGKELGGVNGLTRTNQALVTQMDAKDREIDRLQTLVEATAPVSGLDPERLLDVMQGTEMVDQDYRDAKIVELAKKSRSLNLSLQREKTKSSQLAGEVSKLRALNEQKSARLGTGGAGGGRDTGDGGGGGSPTRGPRSGEDAKAARVALGKLAEQRSKNDLLQKDLKKAHRALQREIGPDIALDRVLDNKGGREGQQ